MSGNSLAANTYALRGVSSQKTDIHKAIQGLDPGLYPTAFCKILPDRLGKDPDRCNIMHADTGGSKASLAYLIWKVTGDTSVFSDLAFDPLVMNTDDVGCVGVDEGFLVNQTIARNTFLVPPIATEHLMAGAQKFCALLTSHGIPCDYAGGETADVADLSRTLDVGNSLVAAMQRKNVIDAGNMVPGDFLIGFSSTGKARWEDRENSGIGSNGLTNGRHDCLWRDYRQYTETYAPEMPKDLVYRGKLALCDKLPGSDVFTIGGALSSPTRTYMPLLKKLLDQFERKYIHGIIHCTGGGQTKIRKFGRPGNRYHKFNLFEIPPLFKTIQKESRASWREMYQTYNMGHRLEIAVSSEKLAYEMINLSMAECDIDAQIIGMIEPGKDNTDVNTVVIDVESEEIHVEYPDTQPKA